MSSQITNLKRLGLSSISGSDLLIITDVTSSGQIETKKITISDLSDYIITSSNINLSFRTGSFKGNFIGIFTGSADSSSFSISASNSSYTNHLIYSSNNGTSSYSINSSNSNTSATSIYSVSSSISNQSNYSLSSSIFYKNTNEIFADVSDITQVSVHSLISQKSLYVSPSDNNGIIYHAMYSDKSGKAYKANKLNSGNSAIMDKSYFADIASIANTSSFSDKSLYAQTTTRAQKILSGNADAWAHCSFKIDENYQIIPMTWNNISSIQLILQPQDFPGPQILITYDKTAPTGISLAVKSSCSPFTPTPISDFSNLDEVLTKASSFPINYFISSWASSCSSTAARISMYGYTINWSGWSCIKRFLGICKVRARWLYSQEIEETLYLKNCIFSFVAFPVPSYTQSEISGSSAETPPTTLSTKC